MGTIKRVAVIGCGTVGASWAALFMAHGLDVAAYDPGPGAEERLHTFILHARDQLLELGAAGKGQLRFTADLAEALHTADFVQENAPENEALKRRMLADIETLTSNTAIVASSTSALRTAPAPNAKRRATRTSTHSTPCCTLAWWVPARTARCSARRTTSRATDREPCGSPAWWRSRSTSRTTG